METENEIRMKTMSCIAPQDWGDGVEQLPGGFHVQILLTLWKIHRQKVSFIKTFYTLGYEVVAFHISTAFSFYFSSTSDVTEFN